MSEEKEPCVVLLVDDDEKVLHGLRRSLKTIEPKWQILTETKPMEALGLIEKHAIDVIVSDLRMPVMDGADFLEKIQKRKPEIIRFVLSGQAGQDLMIKSSAVAHRYLTKPCDVQMLAQAIREAMEMTHTLSDVRTKQQVSHLKQLPTMPMIYQALLEVLKNPQVNSATIEKVISQDPSMVLKIMQTANSAYFGVGGTISTLHEAIILLGVEIIKGLVLVGKIFEQHQHAESRTVQIFWSHSIQTSTLAHHLYIKRMRNEEQAGEAFTAAMLHDIGKLIFYETFETRYRKLLRTSKEESIPLWQLEKTTYGNSHAEVGAQLLHLWGLPSAICEAVEFHHTPNAIQEKCFSCATAVHIADAVAHAQSVFPYKGGMLDTAYLKELGLPDSLEHWMYETQPAES
ncbi:MAG: HDOD domain-containing protein [Verrucomicrobiota bacterium]